MTEINKVSVVPAELVNFPDPHRESPAVMAHRESYAKGWNDARKAMLSAAPMPPTAQPAEPACGIKEGESIEQAAEGWAQWCEVRGNEMLANFLRKVAQPVRPAVSEPIVFKDSDAGRSYLVNYFANNLKRHDYASYIRKHLAADFACTLSSWLANQRVAAPTPQPQQSTSVQQSAGMPEFSVFGYGMACGTFVSRKGGTGMFPLISKSEVEAAWPKVVV